MTKIYSILIFRIQLMLIQSLYLKAVVMMSIGKSDTPFLRVLPFCLCAALLAMGAAYSRAQQLEKAPAVTYAVKGAEAANEAVSGKGADDYSLKIVFADPHGRSLKEVALRIIDEKGIELLNVPQAGPVFFAKLEPGVYDLVLTFKGESKSIAAIKVPKKGTKQVYLYWD